MKVRFLKIKLVYPKAYEIQMLQYDKIYIERHYNLSIIQNSKSENGLLSNEFSQTTSLFNLI